MMVAARRHPARPATRRRSRTVPFALALTAALAGTLLLAAPAFAAAPTVTSFTPTSGKLSSFVTISGSNFSAPATVSVNGVASSVVTVTSATQISASVPSTASTGKITVTTAGGTATSTGTFTIVPGVSVSLAATGPPTANRVASFSGFGAFEAVDVYFDTTDIALASASQAGAGTVTITVSATAAPGAHTVTAVGRHSGYSAQSPFTVRTDWPRYGFDIRHGASNPYENVLNTGNVSGLTTAWQVPNAGGTVAYGTPAVVGGTVYAATAQTITAYLEGTGAVRWTKPLGTGFVSSPTVLGGVVYVGGQNGKVYALDAATGAVKWSRATGDAVQSSPAVVNNIVYVGSFDGKVYALNAATGGIVWTATTGAGIASSPAVVGGVVYIGSLDGKVYALDAANGNVRWTFATSNSVFDPPTVANGRVYVGNIDGRMYALRASSGSLQWSYSTGGTILGLTPVSNGLVYVGSGDGTMTALNASTGVLRWSTALSSGGLIQDASVENGVLYTGDFVRTYALVPSYGGLLTTIDAGSDLGGSAVVDGSLFINDFYDGLTRFTLTGDRPAPGVARPDPASLRPGSRGPARR